MLAQRSYVFQCYSQIVEAYFVVYTMEYMVDIVVKLIVV